MTSRVCDTASSQWKISFASVFRLRRCRDTPTGEGRLTAVDATTG